MEENIGRRLQEQAEWTILFIATELLISKLAVCEEWKAQNRQYYDCKDCGKSIYFDESQKSSNNKYIPIDKHTGQPHECSEGKEEGKQRESKD